MNKLKKYRQSRLPLILFIDTLMRKRIKWRRIDKHYMKLLLKIISLSVIIFQQNPFLINHFKESQYLPFSGFFMHISVYLQLIHTKNTIMKLILIFLVLSALSIMSHARDSVDKVELIKLNENWQFQILNASSQGSQLINNKYPTEIPSTIHLDLLKNEKIPDPFYRNNFQQLKWVSQCTVKYTKKILIKEKNLYKAIELVFHGIDTYAQVFMNKNLILTTNNAFKTYTVRIQNYIKKDQQNILEVIIEPTQKFQEEGQKKFKMPFSYAHTRKPKYQYVWDSAPEINTLGIWKDVQLRFFEQIRIDYVWVRNRFVSEAKATINFAVKFEINLPKNTKLDPNAYTVFVYFETVKVGKAKVTQNQAYIDVTILSPVLWWPNGIGRSYVYDFEIFLVKNLERVDSKNISFGIKTTELYLLDKTFIVKINGHQIFCKGANYVPMDIFYPRLINKYFRSEKTYTIEKLLNDVVSSNFNMLRIWGGGSYVSQQFLELASRRGIMLFYDFMFSESLYPTTAQFFQNVQEEIKYQIRIARNYPAVTLWNGNNEIFQRLLDKWNTQDNLKNYSLLFENLISQIVRIQSPFIPYVPSSPFLGVGNQNLQKGGDVHYWGVWENQARFQAYQTAVGYFNSQYGIQALPVMASIEQFTKEIDRTFNTKIFISHQRSSNKFGTLQFYLNQYANSTQSFENNVYLSGILQAYGIQQAIRSHRCSTKPKSHGTLYWHLNDAWPGITFSSIDYYGRWKPLQYRVKYLYENLAVFTRSDGTVVVNNDNFRLFNLVTVKIFVLLFDGTVIMKQQINLVIDENQSKQIYKISKKQIKNAQSQILVYCQLYENEIFKMSSIKYFSDLKSLNLPKAQVIVKYNKQKNTVSIKSQKLVKYLYIFHSSVYLRFSDNYFDLVPNIQITIQLMENKLEDVSSGLKFISLRQATISETLDVQIQQS